MMAAATQRVRRGSASESEHDARGDAPSFDVADRLVDRLQPADLADDLRLAGGVELEDLAQVGPRADDRTGDCYAAEDRFEDRQRDRVVGGQSDEHEGAVATK